MHTRITKYPLAIWKLHKNPIYTLSDKEIFAILHYYDVLQSEFLQYWALGQWYQTYLVHKDPHGSGVFRDICGVHDDGHGVRDDGHGLCDDDQHGGATMNGACIIRLCVLHK